MKELKEANKRHEANLRRYRVDSASVAEDLQEERDSLVKRCANLQVIFKLLLCVSRILIIIIFKKKK